MKNEDLAVMFEACRSAQSQAAAQVGVWERWAEAEAEAHEQLKEGAMNGGLED